MNLASMSSKVLKTELERTKYYPVETSIQGLAGGSHSSMSLRDGQRDVWGELLGQCPHLAIQPPVDKFLVLDKYKELMAVSLSHSRWKWWL